ncbi:hypothetical protein V757_01100 [Pelistega indica]|uniref:DUF3383 domain-containing protein n=1 Tax=Pelistega indica TaxID=1414851 RepID=V8G9A1_9BURK|nr:DUF3383 domain-containing protein [Pelistega indica]ETD72970.1 hypothetical protein V757_01100 [Pelistega indica]
MALSISNIVNVQLQTVPKSATRRDFGTVLLMTPESGNAFTDSKTRYVYVNSQNEVEQLFGTHSETARASQPFFAQKPRAKQLVIGAWNKAQRTINATSNQLTGASLNDSLEVFKRVIQGQFSIRLGGVEKKITNLNFSEVQDFNGIASLLQTAINEEGLKNYTVTYDQTGNRFIVSSAESGVSDDTIVGYVYGNADSNYIGAMLKLEDGQATRQLGVDSINISAETPAESLTNLLDINNAWYGLCFAAQLTDGEIEEVAKFAQINVKLFALNVIKSTQLEFETGNIIKKLFDAQLDHTLAVYDKDDLYAAHSAIARLLSVNFAAQNSTLTLKFKTQPTITADQVTGTEYQKAKRLGINVYTYFDDVPLIAEGTVIGGKFADEIVILDWFQDAVQKEVFARLYKSPTKLPLTDKGNAVLIDAVISVCLEGINNGAFAPGKWTGDSFGELETGDHLDEGYYVWAAPMDTLSDSDREQRRATPIQTAVKLAGAIHFSDVIINFNR